jgi:ketosteroid isomerase-like protein
MTRFALALWMILAAPALVVAQSQKAPSASDAKKAEQEIVAAIRGRLDALAHNDIAAWSRYVADDMLAPLEGPIGSKQALIKQRENWPREVKYYYGPLEDVRVRIHGDTVVVTYRAKQYNEIGGQTTYNQTWQMETWMRRGSDWLLISVADCAPSARTRCRQSRSQDLRRLCGPIRVGSDSDRKRKTRWGQTHSTSRWTRTGRATPRKRNNLLSERRGSKRRFFAIRLR